MEKIPKDLLGLAAEYAVASELCKRNIYAQLTLGHRKRTDILIETEKAMGRIQVKSKQERQWPFCGGIDGKNIVLVFVDFEHKKVNDRPDFYILTVEDWKSLLKTEDVKCQGTKPDIEPKMIKANKEKWDKIERMVRGQQ